MRLEYVQLIDRIVELDVSGRAIKTLAQLPLTSTIFDGHFPRHPLMSVDRADVVVVGSGFGGNISANPLAFEGRKPFDSIS
jgi:hypothetical protein